MQKVLNLDVAEGPSFPPVMARLPGRSQSAAQIIVQGDDIYVKNYDILKKTEKNKEEFSCFIPIN